MDVKNEKVAEKFFQKEWSQLRSIEQKVASYFLKGKPVSRDVVKEFQDERTFGQRVADRVATFGGSWPFLFLFAAVLVAWVVLNSVILKNRGAEFDPYPYILLNLLLSMLAAIQAPVIMMSQNRMAAQDRIQAQQDYEVNLKAELEIGELRARLDAIGGPAWEEHVALQKKQVELLEKALEKLSGGRQAG